MSEKGISAEADQHAKHKIEIEKEESAGQTLHHKHTRSKGLEPGRRQPHRQIKRRHHAGKGELLAVFGRRALAKSRNSILAPYFHGLPSRRNVNRPRSQGASKWTALFRITLVTNTSGIVPFCSDIGDVSTCMPGHGIDTGDDAM